MAKNKFSKIFMLEVRANKTQERAIEFLVTNLIETVKMCFPTAKVGRLDADREE